MSDKEKAPEINIPIKVLEKKDEQGNLIGAVTPTIAVIQRGALKGNPYPVIKVTKENLNSYFKFRGVENVIDRINAFEAQVAQGTMQYVLAKAFPTPEEADYDSEAYVDGGVDPETSKPLVKILLDKFVSVIEEFWKTLSEGKVRSGETIDSLEEDKKVILAEMQEIIKSFRTLTDPVKAKEAMDAAAELNTKHAACEERIAQIRAERKPRKTKAEKAAETLAAAKALAAQGQAATPAPATA